MGERTVRKAINTRTIGIVQEPALPVGGQWAVVALRLRLLEQIGKDMIAGFLGEMVVERHWGKGPVTLGAQRWRAWPTARVTTAPYYCIGLR